MGSVRLFQFKALLRIRLVNGDVDVAGLLSRRFEFLKGSFLGCPLNDDNYFMKDFLILPSLLPCFVLCKCLSSRELAC